MNQLYYLCPSCHYGTLLLAQEVRLCAGGLGTSLALAGVQLPFEAVTQLDYQLSGILVRHNTVRKATGTWIRKLWKQSEQP